MHLCVLASLAMASATPVKSSLDLHSEADSERTDKAGVSCLIFGFISSQIPSHDHSSALQTSGE